MSDWLYFLFTAAAFLCVCVCVSRLSLGEVRDAALGHVQTGFCPGGGVGRDHRHQGPVTEVHQRAGAGQRWPGESQKVPEEWSITPSSIDGLFTAACLSIRDRSWFFKRLFVCFILSQGHHHVTGGLRAEDEPRHREKRFPGERAGREGEPAGVGAETERRSSRWAPD